MAAKFEINVVLKSGKQALFTDILYGREYASEKDGIKIRIGSEFPSPITVTPPCIDDPVASISYNLYTDMKNYHKVIIPESGRWWINMTQLVSFWRFNKESAIDDSKMPIYIFTGQDLYMSMAFGVIGENYETSFRTLEPKVNRALIAYMRRLSMQITRGTATYPIPESVSKRNPDGSITEYLYFVTSEDRKNESWVLTLRDFASYQKKFYDLPDFTIDKSMAPVWCSWTDWFSDDVTDEVIVKNVKEGVKLGIRNYIIDDGWFGPGLDNDFDVRLNIGDWRPDPKKIKDMGKLVQDIKKEGGVPMIWCAPHAVAEGADCFEERKKYLIRNKDGELLLTGNKFHSLCFMCPEAREIMADICAGFVKEWDFDGAKYDLFNCIPNMKCTNPDHHHDVTSMMEGLALTLELIDKKTRAIKKDYIVELKQNYGTPFLARYGTMMRAGDTPYNPEGNFMRTLYIQAYTPFSINDYQTITNMDSPEDAACIVLKMMAVGIPSYSIDFARLNDDNKKVIANYNSWYNENIPNLKKYRIPQDAENNVFKIPASPKDIFFLVNEGGNIEIEKSTTVMNATFRKTLFVRNVKGGAATITQYNCFGEVASKITLDLSNWTPIEILPGSRIEIETRQD